MQRVGIFRMAARRVHGNLLRQNQATKIIIQRHHTVFGARLNRRLDHLDLTEFDRAANRVVDVQDFERQDPFTVLVRRGQEMLANDGSAGAITAIKAVDDTLRQRLEALGYVE